MLSVNTYIVRICSFMDVVSSVSQTFKIFFYWRKTYLKCFMDRLIKKHIFANIKAEKTCCNPKSVVFAHLCCYLITKVHCNITFWLHLASKHLLDNVTGRLSGMFLFNLYTYCIQDWIAQLININACSYITAINFFCDHTI